MTETNVKETLAPRDGREILDDILLDRVDGELKLSATEVENLRGAVIGLEDKQVAGINEEELARLERMIYEGRYTDEIEINPALEVRFSTLTQKQVVEEITRIIREPYDINAKYGQDVATLEELVRAVQAVKYSRDKEFTEFSPDGDYRAARKWLSESIPVELYDRLVEKYRDFVSKVKFLAGSDFLKKS